MNMSARDISVGDKLRRPQWIPDEHVTVTAVSERSFIAIPSWNTGQENLWGVGADWEVYEEPVTAWPERWINVNARDMGVGHKTRALADFVSTATRIGVIHLFADGSLEMESV
jgi:hypothetical protein